MATPKWARLYQRITLILLCSIFATLGNSQENQVVIRNFDCGLVDLQDAAEIGDGCAQSLQNVDVWSGKIEKRRGSIKQNSSAISGNTEPTILIHEFIDSSDNFHMLFAVNGTIYRSADGGGTFEILASSYGFTSASQYQAVTAFNIARLTDGTTHWLTYDGTNIGQDNVSTQGKLAEFYSERIWTADISGDRSTLFASRFQDVTDWTSNDTDDGEAVSFPIQKDDGSPIRALIRFKDILLVFKDTSLHQTQVLSDGLTFVISPISTTIGTLYPTSIQIDDRGVIFLHSTGVYLFNGIELIKISDPIHNKFYSITQLVRGEDSWKTTTSADFSSGTITDSLSTTQIDGSITFSTGTLLDDFSDGNFNNNPTWILDSDGANGDEATGQVVSEHYFTSYFVGADTVSYISRATTTFNASQGSWSFDIRFDVATSDAGLTDDEHGVGVFISTGLPGGSGDNIQPTIGQNWGDGINFSSRAVSIQFLPSHWSLWTYNFGSGGASRQHRVTPSLNVFDGEFHTVIISIFNEGSNSFSDVNIAVDDVVYLTCTNCISSAAPFGAIGVQAESDPSENISLRVDNIQHTPLTGIYQSQPHDMTSSAVNWGTFEVNDTISFSTITYTVYIDSDTDINTSDTLTFGSSQTITSGQTPTIPFDQFVTVTSSFTRGSFIWTASLQDFTVSWLTGAGTLVPVSLTYQNDYFLAVAIDSTTANDTILVFDRKNRWTIYKGLIASSMLRFRDKPYYGSQDGDTNIYNFQVDNLYSDDSNAIQSKWRSKEFDFGFPATDKTNTRYYITAERVLNSEATFEYFVNRSTNGISTTLDLDQNNGIFIEVIRPDDFEFNKGLTHSFEISSDIIDDYFKLYTITIKPRLETNP